MTLSSMRGLHLWRKKRHQKVVSWPIWKCAALFGHFWSNDDDVVGEDPTIIISHFSESFQFLISPVIWNFSFGYLGKISFLWDLFLRGCFSCVLFLRIVEFDSFDVDSFLSLPNLSYQYWIWLLLRRNKSLQKLPKRSFKCKHSVQETSRI